MSDLPPHARRLREVVAASTLVSLSAVERAGVPHVKHLALGQRRLTPEVAVQVETVLAHPGLALELLDLQTRHEVEQVRRGAPMRRRREGGS